MSKEEFEVNQRVKIYDDDDHCFVYGHVKGIGENYVVVKWNDLTEVSTHYKDEFGDIKKGTPD